MSALRKGWCPGALRPMPAKDGLLVRLRITGGILPAATAIALVDLAERCGNGLFDLSSRANLQMRGVRERALPQLHDGLSTLGLLDSDAAGEAVRNVIASPLAGLHDGLDIRPLTRALEHRLVEDATLHALPPKFGFLIDDGSTPTLTDVAADVRFDWAGDGFAVGLGGTRDTAAQIGVCAAEALVEQAARLGKAAVERFGMHPNARRMHDLVAQIGVACFSEAVGATPLPACKKSWASDRKEGAILTFVAPFGALDGIMMRGAVAVAASTSVREIRLTPWRTILIPGASHTHVPGFITDAADPRQRVAACVGMDGCAHGTTRTRRDAARLAAHLDCSEADDILLHVSGCAKGCAKASPSPVTLVARDGRYDLVRDGRACDEPVRAGLSLDEVRALLSAALEPA